MSKILIAFGSRYGSTKEISEKLVEILRENNNDVKLIDLAGIKKKDWPNLKDFDGLLVGSGIKIKKWTKESKKFLNYVKSSNINMPIGVFVSCGDANDPNKCEEAREKYIKQILDDIGLKAITYDAFGGVIDLTESSNIGKMMRKMLNAAADEDPSLEKGQRNDGRDWNQIEEFAVNFSKLV